MASCCESEQNSGTHEAVLVTHMTSRDNDGQGMISSALHAAVIDKIVNTLSTELRAVRETQVEMERQLKEWMAEQGDVLAEVKVQHRELQAETLKAVLSRDIQGPRLLPRQTKSIKLDCSPARSTKTVSDYMLQESCKTEETLFQAGGESWNPVSQITERGSVKPYGRVTPNACDPTNSDLQNLFEKRGALHGDMNAPAWRRFAQKIVGHLAFDLFFGILILANAIFIAFEVEYCTMNDTMPVLFVISQYLFCFLFIVELTMRTLAAGLREVFLGKDWAWGWVDATMITVSIVEVIDTISSTDGNQSGSPIIRLVRIGRLARVVRVLRFSPQMLIMLVMIMDSVKSLFFALILISTVLFVFSICFTMGATEYLKENNMEATESTREVSKFYGSIFSSAYTLYKSVTGGQSWGECLDPMFDMGGFYCAIFLFWIAFAVLAMLNIITGFFVDSALAKSSRERGLIAEKELNRKNAIVHSLQEIFLESDTDRTGTVEFHEFRSALRDERVAAYLSALGIDTSHLGEIFMEIDTDGSGFIDMDEFVHNMQRVMGAGSLDVNVQRILVESRHMYDKLRRKVKHANAEIAKIRGLMERDLSAIHFL